MASICWHSTSSGPGPRLMTANTLEGNAVINQADETLGTITDIMLDEVPHEASQANWQVSNIDAMRSAGVDRVFTNPGTVPCLDLLFASDAVCVAEQSWETYRDSPPPQWLAERFAGRTWHLVHSVPADELDQVTALAEQRGAGFLWATDATLPNPWGRLPHGLG